MSGFMSVECTRWYFVLFNCRMLGRSEEAAVSDVLLGNLALYNVYFH